MLEFDNDHLADEADLAARNEQIEVDAGVSLVREAAANIPVGEPGDCDLCGEWSGRLVDGVCAPCRDRHKLP